MPPSNRPTFTRRSFLRSVGAVAALASAGLPRRVVGQDAKPSSANPPLPATGAFSVHTPDGLTLTAQAQGDPQAPEVLFIHGLRQSRLSWDKQFADPALAGLRLVRFDLRGHGDSDKPASPDIYADPDRWADDVAAVIAAAKLRRPVLVGWSLGGYVTGAYLRKHGGALVAGINLVAAVTKLSPDLLTPLAGKFAGTTISHDLSERTAETVDFLAACFHQPPAGVEWQRMLVVNGMTARAVAEGFVKTPVPDMGPVFAEYKGPTLLTHGAHDQLVRVAMSERIKTLCPDSRLSVYENAGHTPFYEEPGRFGQELATFVAAANRVDKS